MLLPKIQVVGRNRRVGPRDVTWAVTHLLRADLVGQSQVERLHEDDKAAESSGRTNTRGAPGSPTCPLPSASLPDQPGCVFCRQMWFVVVGVQCGLEKKVYSAVVG